MVKMAITYRFVSNNIHSVNCSISFVTEPFSCKATEALHGVPIVAQRT